MSLLLPKGIVVNSPDISGNIERINTEPLDPADIARFWKVYTTTRRRLLDPTAERLENYWWRIWGSQRRELNGATVARLFAHISDGQSFVPLRGPENRDEGTPLLRRNDRHGPAASSAIFHSQSRPSTTSSSTTSRAPAPMPHPILKKSRGPSTTGPRPTARFISPHDSENEPSSSISPNSHVVVQPPSPDPQNSKTDKKLNVPVPGNKKGQGFVASTAGKKKRPVIVRRKSSQSSTEIVTKTTDAPLSSSERAPPTFSDQSNTRGKSTSQSKFQENFSPSPERSPRKRNSSQGRDSLRISSRKSSPAARKERGSQGSELGATTLGQPGPSTLRNVENHQALEDDVSAEELEELELQRTLLAEAKALVEKKILEKKAQAAQNSPKPQSTEPGTSHEAQGALRYLGHDRKSSASLAPTLTAAAGQIDLGGDSIEENAGNVGKGKGRDLEELGPAEMFAKRPVLPVTGSYTPAPDAPASLARSKSQLTLLLEKDRSKSGEQKSKHVKKRGKKE